MRVGVVIDHYLNPDTNSNRPEQQGSSLTPSHDHPLMEPAVTVINTGPR